MDQGRLERLLDAVLAVAGDLALPTVLNRIAEAAATLVGARYAALGVLGDDEFLSDFVYTGIPPETAEAIGHLPEGHGILGLLIDHPQVLRLDDLTTHPRSYGFPEGHPPMRSFLGAPVRVGGRVFGNIYLTEKASGAQFTEEDEELVVALAAVAGSAIERTHLHEQLNRLSVMEDRERIGRDLHDLVIQRLFATGLGLQAVERRLHDRPEEAARIDEAIDALDDVIREIRSTIFQLQADESGEQGLRRQVTTLVRELEAKLGHGVSVRFDGPVDTVTTAEVAEHVVAVLREALTNVARHAQASEARVKVMAADDQLVLEVVDNGVGPPPQPTDRGLGLRNIEARARQLGGSCSVRAAPGGGMELRWSAPLAG